MEPEKSIPGKAEETLFSPGHGLQKHGEAVNVCDPYSRGCFGLFGKVPTMIASHLSPAAVFGAGAT